MFNPYRALNSKYYLPKGERLQLARRSSLLEGLKFYLVGQPSVGRVVDLVLPTRTSTAVTRITSPLGAGFKAGSFTNASTTDLAFTSGPWTVAVFVFQNAVVGNGDYCSLLGRYAYTNESSNTGFSLDVQAADAGNAAWRNRVVFVAYRNNGSSNYAGTTPPLVSDALAPGLWSFVGQSDGGTTRQILTNGKVSAINTSVNFSPLTTAGNLLLASHFAGSTDRFRILMAGAWARYLNPAEIQDLHSYPFQLAESVRPARVFLPTVAATTGNVKSRKTNKSREPRPWQVW